MAFKINKKSFDLYVKTKKSFSLFFEGFTVSDSWTLIIKQYQSIVSSLKLQVNPLLEIINNGAGLLISVMSLISNPSILFSNSIGFVSSFLETTRMFSTFTKDLLLNGILKATSKVVVVMDEEEFTFSAIPVVAIFYKLIDWDDNTLVSMDSQTLEDLDFVTT